LSKFKKYEKILKKLKKNNLDQSEIDLKVDFRVYELSILRNYSPLEINIDIIKYTDLENDKYDVLGEYKIILFKSYTPFDESNNLFYMADDYSGDAIRSILEFIDKKGHLKPEFFKHNIAYIQKMYIKPEYRGKGVGSFSFTLLYGILQELAGVITILPIPHENDGKTEIKKEDKKYKKKIKKLEKFLKQFDFMRAEDGVWYFDTSARMFY